MALPNRPSAALLVEPRYDVVLRKRISRAVRGDLRQCKELYGSTDLYAVSKRQISTREIRAHQLRQARGMQCSLLEAISQTPENHVCITTIVRDNAVPKKADIEVL
jgi:hypothetical protein